VAVFRQQSQSVGAVNPIGMINDVGEFSLDKFLVPVRVCGGQGHIVVARNIRYNFLLRQILQSIYDCLVFGVVINILEGSEGILLGGNHPFVKKVSQNHHLRHVLVVELFGQKVRQLENILAEPAIRGVSWLARVLASGITHMNVADKNPFLPGVRHNHPSFPARRLWSLPFSSPIRPASIKNINSIE
jgi:hypothetical protein